MQADDEQDRQPDDEQDRQPDKKQPLAQVLRALPLFEGLDEAHLSKLMAQGVSRRLEPEQALFREGDAATGLYVILAGRVKVFKVSAKGREQILRIMGAGEPVGEVAVLSGETYPAGAQAIGSTEVFYIPRQAFLDLISAEPEVAMRLLGALCERLRSFASLIEELSLKDVSERLATYLLSLGADAEPGQTLELDISKSQLSAAVGTVPETLSRAFQRLARAGAVETRGRKVRIKDRAFLERVAGLR